MAAVRYDVEYTERRDRLTNAFRLILFIPHVLVNYVWALFAQILAVAQWFIIVFTGERNDGIWRLQNDWLGYYGRISGYAFLLYDQYPPFGTGSGDSPARYSFELETPPSRLTNGLRAIWAIPAAVIAFALTIAAGALILVSWFAIVITGKQPRGMFDFVLRALRYVLQYQSYVLLMTDTYPKFS